MNTIKDVKVSLRADDEEIICDTMTITLKTKAPEKMIEIAFGSDDVIGVRSGDAYMIHRYKSWHMEHTRAVFSTGKYLETLKQIKDVGTDAGRRSARSSLNNKFTDYLYKTVISILWDLGVSKPKDSKMVTKLYNSCKRIAELYLDFGRPKAHIGISMNGLVISRIEEPKIYATAREKIMDFLEEPIKAYRSRDGQCPEELTDTNDSILDTNYISKDYEPTEESMRKAHKFCKDCAHEKDKIVECAAKATSLLLKEDDFKETSKKFSQMLRHMMPIDDALVARIFDNFGMFLNSRYDIFLNSRLGKLNADAKFNELKTHITNDIMPNEHDEVTHLIRALVIRSNVKFDDNRNIATEVKLLKKAILYTMAIFFCDVKPSSQTEDKSDKSTNKHSYCLKDYDSYRSFAVDRMTYEMAKDLCTKHITRKVDENLTRNASNMTEVPYKDVSDTIHYVHDRCESADINELYEKLLRAFFENNPWITNAADITKESLLKTVSEMMGSDDDEDDDEDCVAVKAIIHKWLENGSKNYRVTSSEDTKKKYTEAICIYFALFFLSTTKE